jgi:hypothetical protein
MKNAAASDEVRGVFICLEIASAGSLSAPANDRKR